MSIGTLAVLSLLIFPVFSQVTAKEPGVSLEPIASALGQDSLLTGKVVYVDFWASWCMPCRQSFPWMKEIDARYRDRGLQVITVNLDKERSDATKFLKELGSDLKVIYDPDGALARQFRVDVMPKSFVFARDGTLQDEHRGFRDEDKKELDSAIVSLLSEKEKE